MPPPHRNGSIRHARAAIWDYLDPLEGRQGHAIFGRPPGARWDATTPTFLPTGLELAHRLVDEARFPSTAPYDRDDLAKVSSYCADIAGRCGSAVKAARPGYHYMHAAAAAEAIRKPLEGYNMRFASSAGPGTIEDQLVQAIPAQVHTGRVQLSQPAGVGQPQTRDDTVQIEAPFLQLMMTRLWDTDDAAAQRAKETGPKVAAVESTAPSGIPARIYIQIQDEQQRAGAQRIQQALEAQKFVVPGIERLKTGPTTGAEVRFFREEDRDEANRIADILRGMQVQGTEAKYIAGYEGATQIRPRHSELWFAPDALR